ncbi:TRAP transporter substrate-binding protein [Dehalococcoidia bacterium]|nr:TRAP transporter substrate-binding protein [Dehalococcoidia bacterium]
MKKKMLLIPLVLLLALSLVAAGCPTPVVVEPDPVERVLEREYTLIFATQMPIGHVLTVAADLFVDRVYELSDGMIEIVHHPAGALFTDAEMTEGVLKRGADMATITPARFAAHAPVTNAIHVGFLFESYEHFARFLPYLDDLVADEARDAGFYLLGWFDYGSNEVFVNRLRQILRPADLLGIKNRQVGILGGVAVAAAGGSPVVMSSAEVYMALEHGVIDGANTGVSAAVKRKWYEVAPYITIIPYAIIAPGLPFPLFVNLEVWEGMEPAAQAIMRQAAQEAREFSIDQAMKDDAGYIEHLRQHPEVSLVIIEAGTPEWHEWEEIMGPAVREKFLEIGGPHAARALELADAAR